MVYQYFIDGNDGNPLLSCRPAAASPMLSRRSAKIKPATLAPPAILMLTHVKELIEQNAEKMRQHWHHAPLRIYSAGIGKRQLGWPITFADPVR